MNIHNVNLMHPVVVRIREDPLGYEIIHRVDLNSAPHECRGTCLYFQYRSESPYLYDLANFSIHSWLSAIEVVDCHLQLSGKACDTPQLSERHPRIMSISSWSELSSSVVGCAMSTNDIRHKLWQFINFIWLLRKTDIWYASHGLYHDIPVSAHTTSPLL